MGYILCTVEQGKEQTIQRCCANGWRGSGEGEWALPAVETQGWLREERRACDLIEVSKGWEREGRASVLCQAPSSGWERGAVPVLGGTQSRVQELSETAGKEEGPSTNRLTTGLRRWDVLCQAVQNQWRFFSRGESYAIRKVFLRWL